MDVNAYHEEAKKAKRRQRKFLDRIKKNPPKDLDRVVMDADAEVFEQLDCLKCANCCKTISPIFTQRDIERIAGHLKMKPGQFVETYLRIDEDDDFVLQSSPCTFLEADNRCRIYEVRPKACREYPHTGQRKFSSHIGITRRNVLVCPAAFKVVELLEAHYE